MKNILAENMLRFGVKNLSNSDVKKINESSLLTENFKGADGITYKLDFKDQAAFEKYYTEFPQVANAIKPPWIRTATPGNSAAEDRYAKYMADWNREKNHLLQSIMLAFAYNGYNTSWYAGLTLDAVKKRLLEGANPNELNTQGLRAAYSGNNASPNYGQAYTDFSDRITYGDWAKPVFLDKTKQIPYWDYFRDTYIKPLVPLKAPLIVPKPKPVNPNATKPGVKPVTKN
jgi:hypothetical protein